MALTATGGVLDDDRTPLPPLGLQTIDVTSRSISLKWDSNPGSSDVSLYHIFYREEESTRFVICLKQYNNN